MKLKLLKTSRGRSLSYLLLIIFTLKSCVGVFEDFDDGVGARKAQELAEEKAKKSLLMIEPLAEFKEDHLVRLHQCMDARNSRSLNSSSSSIVISLSTHAPSTMGPTHISDNGIIQREASIKIKK
jgi:hypothetical protein